MTECEMCHREITEEEEVYKISGMVKKTFILVHHIYCSQCGQELTDAYIQEERKIDSREDIREETNGSSLS